MFRLFTSIHGIVIILSLDTGFTTTIQELRQLRKIMTGKPLVCG
jgi:hypothetical protein